VQQASLKHVIKITEDNISHKKKEKKVEEGTQLSFYEEATLRSLL